MWTSKSRILAAVCGKWIDSTFCLKFHIHVLNNGKFLPTFTITKDKNRQCRISFNIWLFLMMTRMSKHWVDREIFDEDINNREGNTETPAAEEDLIIRPNLFITSFSVRKGLIQSFSASQFCCWEDNWVTRVMGSSIKRIIWIHTFSIVCSSV